MNYMKENSYNNEVTETRKLVIEREHSALLIWGITSASIALLIYLIQFFTGDYYWWIWIALPAIALPIHYVVDKKVDAKCEATGLTPLYNTLGRVSKITISLILITALLTFVYSFNAYFVILLILTAWCGFSGFMLNYSQLIQLAAVGVVTGITTRVYETDDSVLIWFAIGLIVLLVMPGVDMLKRFNQEKQKI
jgi:hypothetical protein